MEGILASCRTIAAIDLFFSGEPGDRRSNLLVAQIDALREAIRQVRARAPFRVDAWVVLPDHMHGPRPSSV